MPSITSRRSLGAGAAMGALALGSLTGIGAAPAQAADGCTITISTPSGGGAPQVGDLLTIKVAKTGLLAGVLGGTLNLNVLGGSSPVANQITTAFDPLLTGVQTGLYTVTQNDIGKQLQAAFSQSGAGGLGSVSCASATSDPVGGGSQAGGGGQTSFGATQVASSPRILGKGKVGKRFRSDLGTLNAGTQVSYQWFKKNKKHVRGISGATAPTLKARRGFKGKKVFLVVTYVQPQHTPTSLNSNTKRVR